MLCIQFYHEVAYRCPHVCFEDSRAGRVTPRGWALFAAVSLLWGVPYLFISLALEGLGPAGVVAIRVALGALTLLPFAWHRGLPHLLRREAPRLAVLALVEVAVPFTLIATGERTVSSGLAGILVATEPLFILLLGLGWMRAEPVAPGAWAGVGIGLAGVITLLGVSGAGPGTPLIISAAACYATGALLVRRWFPGAASITLTTAMLMLATPPLAALAAAAGPAPRISVRVVAAVLVLGLGCTAGGFTAFFALIAAGGPAKASFITYVAPLVAVGAGVIVQGEPVTPRTITGALLVLLAAALVCRPQRGDGYLRPASPRR